mgnify:CR=1 FL=1
MGLLRESRSSWVCPVPGPTRMRACANRASSSRRSCQSTRNKSNRKREVTSLRVSSAVFTRSRIWLNLRRRTADAPGWKDRDRDRRCLGHGTRRSLALRARGRAGRRGGRGRRRGEARGRRDHRGRRHRSRHHGRPDEGRGLAPDRVGHREPVQGPGFRLEPRRPSRPGRGRGHRPERLRPGRRPEPAHGADHDRGRHPRDPRPGRRRASSSPRPLRGSWARLQPGLLDVQVRGGGLRQEPGAAAGARRRSA